MNEVIDISFVDRLPVIDSDMQRMIRDKSRTIDTYREIFRRKLDNMKDDAEQMQDYCRKLIGEGADVSEELRELECTGNAMLLVTLFLKREAE